MRWWLMLVLLPVAAAQPLEEGVVTGSVEQPERLHVVPGGNVSFEVDVHMRAECLPGFGMPGPAKAQAANIAMIHGDGDAQYFVWQLEPTMVDLSSWAEVAPGVYEMSERFTATLLSEGAAPWPLDGPLQWNVGFNNANSCHPRGVAWADWESQVATVIAPAATDAAADEGARPTPVGIPLLALLVGMGLVRRR